MPRLPYLQPGNVTRRMTEVFRGYNHNPKIMDGEMWFTKNLTTDSYPLLASRKPRKKVRDTISPGGLLQKDQLYYCSNGRLRYIDPSEETGYKNIDGLTLTNGIKQLVSMGAYIIIFPDGKYYNTAEPSDKGSITFTSSETFRQAGGLDFYACDSSGESVPAETAEYTRIGSFSYNQFSQYIKAGGTINISGLDSKLDGEKYIYSVFEETGEDPSIAFVIKGRPSTSTITYPKTVTFSRTIPDMDFVIECQNRLWGCKYGQLPDGKVVNEIYCSALGNFKSWYQYEGISTDSWAASVGSDGEWTGAINYLGRPCFFKRDCVHIVTVSPVGAHRVDENVFSSVQPGSAKSLQIVGDTLYYKGENGVYAWQGGFPVLISEALGEARYSNGVGGTFGNKYYLSMEETANPGNWHLFAYDTVKALWIREDNFHALEFATSGEELFAINADDNGFWAFNGVYEYGTEEDPVEWEMQTGMLYYEYPDKKYLSRYDIRLSMAADAEAKIWMEYDSSGTWLESGTIRISGTGTCVIPIRPRRCDHLRMRLTGTGAVKILSVARILEVGSDV